MLKRRFVRLLITMALAVTAIFATTTAANAASSFTVAAVHANGAGATAVQITGSITWYSRSVSLTGLHLWVNANECGNWSVYGYQGDTFIDGRDSANWSFRYCAPATGAQSWPFSDITLDGSAYPGGITRLVITADDMSHIVYTQAICLRPNTFCV